MLTVSISNQPLAKPLRSQLENTVKSARDVAEKAALSALQQMAVSEAKAPDYLSDDLKALRRRLRAHGRALGDVKAKDDTQGLQHLVWEVAYEHWHRMLFARFLAENGLLMWELGAPVSLEDCQNLVDHEQAMLESERLASKTQWELAGKLAARMLPQVFKPQSPVFELAFAPEHQRELERLLAGLPSEVFKASDSLGWVYQFWQAKRKDEVNASEVKIGADELPAVTQLFTEPYMVDFLLHNSLGAWWVTRHPGKPCPVPLTYLRTLEDGTPAAGKFEGWPDRLEDFKLLDPCCGSGHFLVAAFLLLVPMRMAAEGLSAMDAVDAVLADNLYGLELDARCVEIAVFALALAAWRFLDENGNPLGVQVDMPQPPIACCGRELNPATDNWEQLVPAGREDSAFIRQELRALQTAFKDASVLGSLIEPDAHLRADLANPDFESISEYLSAGLAGDSMQAGGVSIEARSSEAIELTLGAKGLTAAARILSERYHLVATNVPYLARGKHGDLLRDYCQKRYPRSKSDLATVFIERCLKLCDNGSHIAIVSPRNWWFLSTYSKFRRELLAKTRLGLMVALGEEAWEYFGDRGPLATLMIAARADFGPADSQLSALDLSALKTLEEKKVALLHQSLEVSPQVQQLSNPDARIAFGAQSELDLLSTVADGLAGICTGDYPRFGRVFWEVAEVAGPWAKQHTTVDEDCYFGGLSQILFWESGKGALFEYIYERLEGNTAAWIRGLEGLGRRGVLVSAMRYLPASLFLGNLFDNNVALILPNDDADLAAIWCYCSTDEFRESVRRIDQKVNVTNATLVKVPFDREKWVEVATNRYPNGLPKPYSDDQTQWLFHGHPQPATDPLQVAVARLVGYRWPAETDTAMELADEARIWIARGEQLAEHTDDDGIICLPSVRGEAPAHDRLLKLLIAAWETAQSGSWKPSVLDKLLADADCAGKGLDVWLREKFFEQHAKCFHHRPFIWHVWDGLKDGFAALVNYHQLDHKKLERLIHTYLGDWIRQQEAGVRSGVDGAPTRLAAAQDLKRRLELILEGEPPYDIFVRWKKLSGQPIGWNPDLNDGVRLNIRPFMTAEVLRHNKKPKLNITWDKDRGKDVESAPWFKVFKGDRINDHHLTVAEKKKARGESP